MLTLDLNEAHFSVSQLLIETLQVKQSEISNLKNSIERTEALLREPATKNASFATPIYSPADNVEPKRILITIIGFFAGALIGVFRLIMRRISSHNL